MQALQHEWIPFAQIFPLQVLKVAKDKKAPGHRRVAALLKLLTGTLSNILLAVCVFRLHTDCVLAEPSPFNLQHREREAALTSSYIPLWHSGTKSGN